MVSLIMMKQILKKAVKKVFPERKKAIIQFLCSVSTQLFSFYNSNIHPIINAYIYLLCDKKFVEMCSYALPMFVGQG